MIAIVDIGTGAVLRYAESTEGLDMEGLTEIALPDGFDPVQPSHVLIDGKWAENLAFHKRRMIDQVNERAEQVRGMHLTPGSGQAITYARKEEEARRWTEEADEAGFPFLSAEAAATGATLAETAALVLAQANAWVMLGSAIEGHRRGLVVAIEAAETLEEIDIAGDWPGT